MRDVSVISVEEWDRFFAPIVREIAEGLPSRHQHEMAMFQQMTLPAKRQPLDEYIEEIAPYFQDLRDDLPPVVRMYRGQPKAIPAVDREFLSWTIDPHAGARYALHLDRPTVFCADIDTRDVMAAYASPNELLIKNRRKYLTTFAYVPVAVVDPEWWDWKSEAAEWDHLPHAEMIAEIGPEPETYLHFDNPEEAIAAGFEESDLRYFPKKFEGCPI